MDAVDDRNDHRHPGDDDQRPGRNAMRLADPVRAGRVAEPEPRARRDQGENEENDRDAEYPSGNDDQVRDRGQPTGVSAMTAPRRISVGVSEPRSSSIC